MEIHLTGFKPYSDLATDTLGTLVQFTATSAVGTKHVAEVFVSKYQIPIDEAVGHAWGQVKDHLTHACAVAEHAATLGLGNLWIPPEDPPSALSPAPAPDAPVTG